MAKFIGQKSLIIIFFLSIGMLGVSFAYLINLYVSTRSLNNAIKVGGTTHKKNLGKKMNKSEIKSGERSDLLNLTNLFAPQKGMSIPGKWRGVSDTLPSETDFSGTFTLTGTVFSDNKELNRAIIFIKSTKEEKSLRKGDSFANGIQIARIGRNFIVVSVNGVEHTVKSAFPEGERKKPMKTPRSISRRVTSRNRGVAEEKIKVSKIGSSSFAVDESSINYLTENINKLITYVRIIPYFESGNAAGFRLAAIRPGSVFQKLGFQAGDIIKNVNGVPLTSPEKIYTIFQNLKDEKHIDVDILRKGKKSSLQYEVR